jgi:hypothetical protein
MFEFAIGKKLAVILYKYTFIVCYKIVYSLYSHNAFSINIRQTNEHTLSHF